VSTLLTIIAYATVALLFDTIASFALRAKPNTYGKLRWVSMSIYTLTGLTAARLAQGDTGTVLLQAALAGAAVAGIDATLGWVIAAAIGPGKLPEGIAAPRVAIARTVLIVMLMGVIAALIGGTMALLIRR
jgi:hypothetical protein